MNPEPLRHCILHEPHYLHHAKRMSTSESFTLNIDFKGIFYTKSWHAGCLSLLDHYAKETPMLRPTYLFSTAVLAAAAMVQWQDTTATSNHPPTTAVSKQTQALIIQMPSAPAQTISGKEVRKPAQPQRWVF